MPFIRSTKINVFVHFPTKERHVRNVNEIMYQSRTKDTQFVPLTNPNVLQTFATITDSA